MKIDSFLSIQGTLFLEFSEQSCLNKHAVKLSPEIIVPEKHRENERSKDRENITVPVKFCSKEEHITMLHKRVLILKAALFYVCTVPSFFIEHVKRSS